MKKFTMLALAAVVATGLASCAKESGGGNDVTPAEEAKLVIRMTAAGAPGTRAIESNATTSGADLMNAIDFDRSEIFIVGKTGRILDHAPLTAAAVYTTEGPSATGQEFPRLVQSGSQVFILANIPEEDYDDVTSKGLLVDVMKYASSVKLLHDNSGESWKTVTLSNSDGSTALVSPIVGGVATADVSISPAVARLELTGVSAAEGTEQIHVTEFKVTGIFVDNFFPRYTYEGHGMGLGSTALPSDLLSLEKSTDASVLTAWVTDHAMGDEGEWTTTASVWPALPSASPDAGDWGYNVAADAVPRLIIRITDVKYTTDGGSTVNDDRVSNIYFLTVKGYNLNGNPITAFERAKVYRISGESLLFGLEDLGETPNDDTGTLTVNVAVEGWDIVEPDAEL